MVVSCNFIYVVLHVNTLRGVDDFTRLFEIVKGLIHLVNKDQKGCVV